MLKMTAAGLFVNYPEKINGTVELAFDLPSYKDVDREYQRVLEAGARTGNGTVGTEDKLRCRP